MNLPLTRQRTIHENEIDFIDEAVRTSGLPGGSVELEWEPHSVTFNGKIELHAVQYDCRALLGTACWTVRRVGATEPFQSCSCGALARESADGTYGSLRTAVAAALGELVRLKILESFPETKPEIPRDRPEAAAANHPPNDLLRV